MEDKQPAAEEKTKEAEPEKKEKDPKGNAYDWIESLVTAIVACIIIFLFLFRVVNVQGSSMVPTLRESDKIVISRLARDFRLFSAPLELGINYTINKGTLFGFETGHRVGFMLGLGPF